MKSTVESFIAHSNVKTTKKESIKFPEIFGRQKITTQDKAKFCLEFAVMLQARVSLHRALQILKEQNKKENLQAIFDGLLKEVQKGSSFSSALSKYPSVFDNLFTVTAEVGEESGRLPQVMLNLASYLEKMGSLKRKIIQALAYPALVLSVAALAVLFLLLFIVPTFAEMFKSLKVDLPESTKIILQISRFVNDYGLWMLGGIITGFILFRQILLSRRVKVKIENILPRIPYIGDIISKNLVARFCRTLGTLIQAEVSLVDALDITKRIFTTESIQQEIKNILYHVKQGKNVSEPMVSSKVFPPMVSQMIAVGEETSELDSMLIKVAEFYEKEIDSSVETLSNIIEPVLILLLGCIVGSVLISMYMPMFDLMNVIG